MRRVVGVGPWGLFEKLFTCGTEAIESRSLIVLLTGLLEVLPPRPSIPLGDC